MSLGPLFLGERALLWLKQLVAPTSGPVGDHLEDQLADLKLPETLRDLILGREWEGVRLQVKENSSRPLGWTQSWAAGSAGTAERPRLVSVVFAATARKSRAGIRPYLAMQGGLKPRTSERATAGTVQFSQNTSPNMYN